MKKVNIKKIDIKQIAFIFLNRAKALTKYNFEEIVEKIAPKRYYSVVKEETEKEIKEGVLLVCISLLLTKFLVILMNFCVFFKANKMLGAFNYVFRITFETIIMEDLAKIVVSSIALIVVPVMFLIYMLRYHGSRQKTQPYFVMMIFSLIMILKKAYDIFMAFGTITDSIIVMLLVMALYVIAALGYISILKGCLDFCIYAFDESKKDLVSSNAVNNNVNLQTTTVNEKNKVPVLQQETQVLNESGSEVSPQPTVVTDEISNIQNQNNQNVKPTNQMVGEHTLVNEQNQQ